MTSISKTFEKLRKCITYHNLIPSRTFSKSMYYLRVVENQRKFEKAILINVERVKCILIY